MDIFGELLKKERALSDFALFMTPYEVEKSSEFPTDRVDQNHNEDLKS